MGILKILSCLLDNTLQLRYVWYIKHTIWIKLAYDQRSQESSLLSVSWKVRLICLILLVHFRRIWHLLKSYCWSSWPVGSKGIFLWWGAVSKTRVDTSFCNHLLWINVSQLKVLYVASYRENQIHIVLTNKCLSRHLWIY